jgi:hypothetical protein
MDSPLVGWFSSRIPGNRGGGSFIQNEGSFGNRCFTGIAGRFLFGVFLLLLSQGLSLAQSLNDTSRTVVSVDGDSKTWADAAGRQVVEIATGMNYYDNASQQWVKSDPSFVASPDGSSFAALRMQHQVTLAANLNGVGAVTAVTPDGITLQSTPVAIGLYDAASGKSVTVASLTDSAGALIDAHHVFYQRALVGDLLQADVSYSLPDCGSFHQDIVISHFNGPLDPTAFGFAAGSTKTLQIQFFTEFYGDVPAPQEVMKPIYVEQDPGVRASMVSPDIIDYVLSFGEHYIFGAGRAYAGLDNLAAGNTGSVPKGGVRVAKQFVTAGAPARNFLVESVPYVWLKANLEALPRTQTVLREPSAGESRVKNLAAAQAEGKGKGITAAKGPQYASLPHAGKGSRLAAGKDVGAARLAAVESRRRGVDIDPAVTINGYKGAATFTNGTYFVSGTVYVTSATIQPNVYFKYPSLPGGGPLLVSSTLTVEASPDLPTIFTAGDDETPGHGASVSNVWSNYTGTISGYYANPMLELETYSSATMSNMAFFYAEVGLAGDINTGGSTFSVLNTLFTNCLIGLSINGSGVGSVAYPVMTNCQFGATSNAIMYTDGPLSGTATGSIFDSIGIVADGVGSVSNYLLITNSTLICVTNLTNSGGDVYVLVSNSVLSSSPCSPPPGTGPGPSDVLITANIAGQSGGVPGPLQTMDFQTGNLINSILPAHAGGGRAIAIYNTNIYYTDDDGSGVFVEAYGTDGSGGSYSNFLSNPDTRGISPIPAIQGLAFYSNQLYALTGYASYTPWVWVRTNLSSGNWTFVTALSGGPSGFSCGSTPCANCDGFAILTNGNYLVNDQDGFDIAPVYREYDHNAGTNIASLAIDSSTFGWPRCSGVTCSPTNNSLYFAVSSDTAWGVVQTDFSGNVKANGATSGFVSEPEGIAIPLP